MKKVWSLLKQSLMILAFLVVSSYPASAVETKGLIPQIEILTTGMRRTVQFSQEQRFPQDFGHFLILLVGYGGLSISMSKATPEGDFIIMSGLGISPAGITPILKFGRTGLMLSENIEIGTEHSPYGLLWLMCWADSSTLDPPYGYTLALGF
jgi:hypothetical protein